MSFSTTYTTYVRTVDTASIYVYRVQRNGGETKWKNTYEKVLLEHTVHSIYIFIIQLTFTVVSKPYSN